MRDPRAEPKHLEIVHSPRSGTWTVAPHADSFVKAAQFPSNERILYLAKVAKLVNVYFHVEPQRPGGTAFILYMGTGSNESKRKAFLAALESETTWTLRTFSENDFKRVTQRIAQSPLYLVSIERDGERREEFFSKEQIAYVMDPEHTRRRLLDDVLEIHGSSLVKRNITEEERIYINNEAWRMG